MKQWDIFMFPFGREKRHPAVIISNDETCADPDLEVVNALFCNSARVSRPPKPTEELLDEGDGLVWLTMVRCDRIYLLPKAQFLERKGQVTPERRIAISRKIVEVLRLQLHRS